MNKKVTYAVVVLAVASLVVSASGFISFYVQIADLQQTLDELQNQKFDDYLEVTLSDRMGNLVTLTSAPVRIVSLSPTLTEILFAIGAGNTVVGVTDACDYPYNFTTLMELASMVNETIDTESDVINVTRIGSVYNPSVEPIVELEPDLVLATTHSLETAKNLTALGFDVLVVEARTITEIFSDIILLGWATGNNDEAAAVVTVMRAQIDAIAYQATRAATKPKVYYEIQDNPLTSVGPGTLIDELITLAGGTNIFNTITESWPLISYESVIEKDPDVMVFPSTYMGVDDFDETVETVKSRSGWDSITAVQNDALYEVDADIVSRAGPRIVEALRAIAKMIHPEIFGEP